MVKLLHTNDPDTQASIPVVTDTSAIEITAVRLYRGSVEGNSTALNADVSFDTTAALPYEGERHFLEVYVYVLNAKHIAVMRETMEIKSIADLKEDWDMKTVSSGGTGGFPAVFVKTVLHLPGTY